MTITIKPEHEAALMMISKYRGVSPDDFIARFLQNYADNIDHPQFKMSREEFREGLQALGSDLGGVFSGRPLTSEEIYD